MNKGFFLFGLLFVLNSFRSVAQLQLKPGNDTAIKNFRLQVVPKNFYTQHLSFFCKKELQVQKAISLPVYFRVGTKEYVDYLEKKPNAIGNKQ